MPPITFLPIRQAVVDPLNSGLIRTAPVAADSVNPELDVSKIPIEPFAFGSYAYTCSSVMPTMCADISRLAEENGLAREYLQFFTDFSFDVGLAEVSSYSPKIAVLNQDQDICKLILAALASGHLKLENSGARDVVKLIKQTIDFNKSNKYSNLSNEFYTKPEIKSLISDIFKSLTFNSANPNYFFIIGALASGNNAYDQLMRQLQLLGVQIVNKEITHANFQINTLFIRSVEIQESDNYINLRLPRHLISLVSAPLSICTTRFIDARGKTRITDKPIREIIFDGGTRIPYINNLIYLGIMPKGTKLPQKSFMIKESLNRVILPNNQRELTANLDNDVPTLSTYL